MYSPMETVAPIKLLRVHMETDISVETLALGREMAAQPRLNKIGNRSKMPDSIASLRRRREPPGRRSHAASVHDEDISAS
jgi:hypothetical protein